MRTHVQTFGVQDLGFAFYWLAVVALFQGDIFFTNMSASGISSVEASRTTFMVSISVVNIALLFIAIDRLTSEKKHSYKNLSIFGSCLFLLGLITAQLTSIDTFPTLVMLMVSGVLSGIGTAVTTSVWFYYLGTQSPLKTAQIIPLSFAFAYAVHFVLSFAPTALALCIILLSPLISCYLFLTADIETSVLDTLIGNTGELKTKAYTQALSMLWLPVLTNAILAFCFGFMWQYLLDPNQSVYQGRHGSLLGQLIGALLIFALAKYLRKYVDIDAILKRTLILFFVVFLMAPLVLNLKPSLLSSLVGLGYSLFDIVVWYLLAVCAFDTRTDGGVITGFARACTIGAMAIGSIAGISMQNLQFYDYQSARLIVLTFLILYALYLTSKRFSKSQNLVQEFKGLFDYKTETSEEADELSFESLGRDGDKVIQEEEPDNSDDNPFELQAMEHNLTRREAEVFMYLAQGRTAKFISEELYISNNTVRSHTQRIYEKLGIHSKQELIDLAQEWLLEE